jgi:hypothetical protein
MYTQVLNRGENRMKKLLLAAAACSALFFTVGCSNEFTGGTHTTAADLREIYSTANNSALSALTVTGTDFPNPYTKSTTATVSTVTFSKPMAASSTSAVKVYAVSSADGATKTTALKYTDAGATVTLDEDNPERMFVSVALSGDYYELRVDPTTAVALNGQKLNQDGDAVQGEANDDVYSSGIVSAGTPTTTLTGVPYLPQKQFIGDISFFEVDDGTYSTLRVAVHSVAVYNAGVTERLPLKTFDSTIAAILSNHIKVQEYLPSTGAWSDLAALSFNENTTESTMYYTVYDATFTASEKRDYVRSVINSISTFATASNVYGCPLKAAYNYDGLQQSSYDNDQVYKADVDGSSGYLLSHNPTVSLLTLGYISTPTVKYGKIFITLAPAAKWQAISIDDVTSTKTTTKIIYPFSSVAGSSDVSKCTFAGFDESTITAANFKVVDSNGKYELPITGVTMEKETAISASTTVTYKNVIVITLKDSTISSLSGYNIYVSPNVKTAAVAGVDGDGNATTARSYSLGSSVPATTVWYKGGWQKLY